MYNAAFWAPISLASQGGLINIGIGIVGAKLTHESSISVSFDSNLAAEKIEDKLENMVYTTHQKHFLGLIE